MRWAPHGNAMVPCAHFRVTVHAAFTNDTDGHSSRCSHPHHHFESSSSLAHLPRWLPLAFETALFHGLGCLILSEPRCAPNAAVRRVSSTAASPPSDIGACKGWERMGLQTLTRLSACDAVLHCAEFVDESMCEHVERCASTHSLTPRCRAPAPPAMPAPTASLTTWQADGAGGRSFKGPALVCLSPVSHWWQWGSFPHGPGPRASTTRRFWRPPRAFRCAYSASNHRPALARALTPG